LALISVKLARSETVTVIISDSSASDIDSEMQLPKMGATRRPGCSKKGTAIRANPYQKFALLCNSMPSTDDSDTIISLQDVEEAQQAISNNIVETPFLYSRRLSELTGATIYLKFENRQYTGAFKERGALNKLLSLSNDQREIGVITVSAGNHAQGVAFHASRLGIPSVVVMPVHTPHVKVHRTASFGAEVLLHGENFDEAKKYALKVMEERGLVFVHPYDDAKVIAGQGTIGLEMLAAQPDLDAVVIPVGGGGLISGIGTVMKALRPQVEVIGAQTERFPSMHQALSGVLPRSSPRSDSSDSLDESIAAAACGNNVGCSTIADGIAVRQPGVLTLRIVERLGCEVLLVDEGDIEDAMLILLEVEKTLVEGTHMHARTHSCAQYRTRYVSARTYTYTYTHARTHARTHAHTESTHARRPILPARRPSPRVPTHAVRARQAPGPLGWPRCSSIVSASPAAGWACCSAAATSTLSGTPPPAPPSPLPPVSPFRRRPVHPVPKQRDCL
jgi:threonine dehydratase